MFRNYIEIRYWNQYNLVKDIAWIHSFPINQNLRCDTKCFGFLVAITFILQSHQVTNSHIVNILTKWSWHRNEENDNTDRQE